MLRLATAVLASAAAGGLIACGGSSTTVTKTAPPASTPAGAAAPPSGASGPAGAKTTPPQPAGATSGAAGADAPPPQPAPPNGQPDVEGQYAMRFRMYAPPDYNLTNSAYRGQASTWNATTQCTGTTCSVTVRRALEGGSYKQYTLTPDGDGKYTGSATGTATQLCRGDPSPTPVRERLSIQASAPRTLDGVPTITHLDAYVTQDGTCQHKPVSGSRHRHATASWRGTRVGS